MIDVNTVVGTPIHTGDGTTIIPVSKVSLGFVSGGADFDKNQKADLPNEVFAGGSGAGVGIVPVAFLVVGGGNVKLLPVTNKTTSVDRVIDLMPEIIDKFETMMKNRKEETDPFE
jgi:sporulation protein YtfJ